MNLPLIPQDKANHIVYGFVIYFLVNLFFNHYLALTVVVLFACAKEVYDEWKYGGFDYKDLLVTLAIPLVLFLKTLIYK